MRAGSTVGPLRCQHSTYAPPSPQQNANHSRREFAGPDPLNVRGPIDRNQSRRSLKPRRTPCRIRHDVIDTHGVFLQIRAPSCHGLERDGDRTNAPARRARLSRQPFVKWHALGAEMTSAPDDHQERQRCCLKIDRQGQIEFVASLVHVSLGSWRRDWSLEESRECRHRNRDGHDQNSDVDNDVLLGRSGCGWPAERPSHRRRSARWGPLTSGCVTISAHASLLIGRFVWYGISILESHDFESRITTSNP